MTGLSIWPRRERHERSRNADESQRPSDSLELRSEFCDSGGYAGEFWLAVSFRARKLVCRKPTPRATEFSPSSTCSLRPSRAYAVHPSIAVQCATDVGAGSSPGPVLDVHGGPTPAPGRRRSTAGACPDPGWHGRQNQLGRVLARVTNKRWFVFNTAVGRSLRRFAGICCRQRARKGQTRLAIKMVLANTPGFGFPRGSVDFECLSL